MVETANGQFTVNYFVQAADSVSMGTYPLTILFETGGDSEMDNKRELENERESAATANVTSVVAVTVQAETGSTCDPNCSL